MYSDYRLDVDVFQAKVAYITSQLHTNDNLVDKNVCFYLQIILWCSYIPDKVGTYDWTACDQISPCYDIDECNISQHLIGYHTSYHTTIKSHLISTIKEQEVSKCHAGSIL